MLLGIKRVLLEQGAESTSFGSRILERLPGADVEFISHPRQGNGASVEKQTLQLGSFPGQTLKKCPGTKGYLCCGYQILHIGTNCPMDCSYCILQAYLNQPYLRVFTNLEEKLAELAAHLDAHPEFLFRIGTGEFTDSLALDPVTGWTDLLLPFFEKRRNALLELKTKSVHTERLLDSSCRKRIVVSWSLNSPYVVSREEHGAPSIRQRLEAARRCQQEGFVVGFHFDPLVPHPGWKEEYRKTVDLMAEHLVPENVIWISMGCMRYLPELKSIIRRRHPKSMVLNGEFIPGLDGKMRLFKPVRIEMYAYMAEMLVQWHRDAGLYLCMESPDIWQETLGWTPEDSDGLSRFLDDRARRFFG
ncbi:MAG: DNA photolyase [Deltaproteobacteria bacterium HGW-Deltaproteobacteria-15]|jgi:spore photoproduct lyase|nr:MAG: DNA photolyase [Deltaproteobacteria bacterium HGW-Deltaproteobacteria-15]